MTTEQETNLLQQLQELINTGNKPSFLPIQSKDLFQAYLRANKYHSETIRTYTHQFKFIAEQFPIFPSDHIKINEYIANLKSHHKLSPNYGKDVTNATKHNIMKLMKALIRFAHKNFKYPDYSENLISISPKDKNQAERPFRTPEEMLQLIQSCKTTLHRLIILTLIDSACRIGELGITPEHDGLTINRVHPDSETIEVYGKTGYHRMHCSQELCELLIQNASPEGHIFHSKRMPNGMTSGSLADQVHDIFMYTFKTGTKMGAHTVRHSIASYLADLTGQPLVVQNFLKHAKVDMSMEYIHSSEQRKLKMPSPLKLMGEQFKSQVPIQPKMLVEDTTNTSTSLVPYSEQSIEHVEGTIDLSDKMFTDVPPNIKIRVSLNSQDLQDFRQAFVKLSQILPINDPLPGKLSRRFNMFFKKVKIGLST